MVRGRNPYLVHEAAHRSSFEQWLIRARFLYVPYAALQLYVRVYITDFKKDTLHVLKRIFFLCIALTPPQPYMIVLSSYGLQRRVIPVSVELCKPCSALSKLSDFSVIQITVIKDSSNSVWKDYLINGEYLSSVKKTGSPADSTVSIQSEGNPDINTLSTHSPDLALVSRMDCQ